MTIIGLCLGGTILGIATTALAVVTLWALKRVDLVIPCKHHAMLEITSDATWNVMNDVPIPANSKDNR
jgi:putative Mg2+ transporter-C (MgtC) family protein